MSRHNSNSDGTNARESILKSVRRNLPVATELPDPRGPWIVYDDPVRQFEETLAGVGGETYHVHSVSDVTPLLGAAIGGGRVVVSSVPGLLENVFDWSAIDDPHQLEHVDLFIAAGVLGVAENGAIWIDGAGVPQRVLYFLCQHLALVIDRRTIVNNMYEAYQRIEVGSSPFGCFLSGPSKTADIEQALVKGAHGARTLKVFIVDPLECAR